MTPSYRLERLGSIALAAAGVLFLLYPSIRPWHDETTVAGATASMTSNAWVASHLFAMIGFILVPLGVLALREVIGGSTALAAVVTTWIGAGLTLPYYGAEDFGLHAIAGQYADGQRFDLLDTVDAFRYQPVAVTLFGVGLLSLAVGAVLTSVAINRTGVLPRHSGLAFAAGFVLFLPQFFTPDRARRTRRRGVRVVGGSTLAGSQPRVTHAIPVVVEDSTSGVVRSMKLQLLGELG